MCRWQVIRNFFFRLLHLAAILFFEVEALIGVSCPLTIWEDELRSRPEETRFIARLLHRILYYDIPGWVFLTLYPLFALAVAASFVLIPPVRVRDLK